jgi:hypothetical protein
MMGILSEWLLSHMTRLFGDINTFRNCCREWVKILVLMIQVGIEIE